MEMYQKFLIFLNQIMKLENGLMLKILQSHGGLECGYFYKANPKLLILCLGPTMYNVHSVDEVLHLDTITSQAQLMIDSLEMIAKQ